MLVRDLHNASTDTARFHISSNHERDIEKTKHLFNLELKMNKSKTNVRFYTVDGLNPGVGYTVCFSTIYGEIEQGMEKAMEAGECREVSKCFSDLDDIPQVSPLSLPLR